MKDKILNWLLENKVSFFLCAAVLFGAGIFYIDTHTTDEFKSSFLGGVLVEAHGMLMDIIVFGIVLTLYEKITENRNEIKRLREEILDYRGWNEPEATYRIVGCIKRLNTKKVSQIDLRRSYLQGAELSHVDLSGSNIQFANLKFSVLRGVNLQGTTLGGADFSEANLQGVNLVDTSLNSVNLQGADLWGANLQRASLQFVNLTNANLSDTDLRGADLQNAKLDFAFLQGARIDSLEQLEIINAASSIKHTALLVETHKEKYYELEVL